MKYPPRAAILRAFAMGKVGWASALSEWVDNAFDRHAMRVSFTFEKNALTIQDDGEGTATPHAIVQPGEHTPSPDGLSEYGIGGSSLFLWAGGENQSPRCEADGHPRSGGAFHMKRPDGDIERADWQNGPDRLPAAGPVTVAAVSALLERFLRVLEELEGGGQP